MSTRDVRKGNKSGNERADHTSVALAAMGLEAEFVVLLDGQPVKPEDLFGSPTNIVRVPMMHRVGRSYHLPTGGAMYFDTGVIELATPVIEIAPGCAARAGRSLWESIRFLRSELDAWQEREGHTVHLSGFSTHYNVSFDSTAPPPVRAVQPGIRRSLIGDLSYPARHETIPSPAGAQTVEQLALLLTHILPFPVMLLAANRRSTGIGVRPRVRRVEVTADFTPDAALMIATATFIVGVTRAVMTWPSFELGALDTHDFPRVRDFVPEPHSSRHGWVARTSSYVENPFAANVDAPIWPTHGGGALSLREIAGRVTRYFWPSIAAVGDPRSLRLIEDVVNGRVPSLLALDDRPAAYDSVGHLCTWADLFPVRALPRSRYEQVFIRAIARRKLRLEREWYTPTGMRGWSHVVFTRDRDGTRHVFSLDFLLRHMRDWAVGSRTERRVRRRLQRRFARRRR